MRRSKLVQADQCGLDIADDRQGDALVLVVLGGVDVDVNDLGLSCEFIGVTGDAIVEPSAETEEQIALVNGPVSIRGAVHAEPLHRQGMRFREAAHAHERGGDGDIGLFCEGLQVGVSLGRNDAAAGVEHGALRLGDQGEHLFQLVIGCLKRRRRVAAAELNRRGKHGLEFRLLDVLGNVDDDRAWATAAREIERFFENPGKVLHVHDEVGVLHDRQGHAVEIGLLKRHLTDVFREYLASDCDHGD